MNNIFLSILNKKFGTNFKNTEDILLNIEKFMETSPENENKFLRLKTKRLIAKAISSSCYETFTVSYTKQSVKVEANFYWGEEKSTPAGTGYCELSLSQIFPDQFMTAEEKFTKMEDCARSKALSKAMTNAGIGLGFDIEEPEEVSIGVTLSENTEKPQSETSESGLPKPTPKRGRPRKNPEEAVKEPQILPRQEEEPPVKMIQEEEKAEAEGKEEQLTLSLNESNSTPNELELAFNAVADVGNYKGLTLREIYANNPKNLIFLMNRSETCRKEAAIIVASDAELLKLTQ